MQTDNVLTVKKVGRKLIPPSAPLLNVGLIICHTIHINNLRRQRTDAVDFEKICWPIHWGIYAKETDGSVSLFFSTECR